MNIWRDPWIPSSPDRKVITPRGHTVISRVVALIDPVATQWDEQLIRDIFYPVDANRILQIPINFQAFDDFIAWHLTKHGKFSVRSAYMEQWSHKYRGHSLGDLTSSSTMHLAIWKQLWDLQVPRKIQFFCWRALRGIVPLNTILANRHIPISGGCPICHKGAEDMTHMLFQCDLASKLWTGLGLIDRINHAVQVDRSGSAVLEFLLLEPDSPLEIMPNLNYKEVIAAGCWYLWWLRRRHTHHDSCPLSFRWTTSVLAIVGNYVKSITQRRELNEHKWKRPEARFIKVNVDASYHEEEGSGATAAIIRDEKGRFIAAQCKFIRFAADAVTTEAMAMRDGLNLANRLGFNRVEAESDSLNVVNYCQGQHQWWDAAAAIYAECIDSATSIGKVIFTHCFREANVTAHELAKYSYCNKCDDSWTNKPPVFLIS